MFHKRTSKYTQEEIQGLVCNIPPVGYIYNEAEGKMEKMKILSNSNRHHLQVWTREGLPDDWTKRRTVEKKRQESNPDYFDPELESIRIREWKRRLYGCWFHNNGKSTYITGCHYYYLTYFPMNGGFPDYRDEDRKFFYAWEYCVQDDDCLGLLLVTKRKSGKTQKSGNILLEKVSRTIDAMAVIQSKSLLDAQEVFQKAVVVPFRAMPDFFRPVYDSQGKMKKTLRFFNTSGNIEDDSRELRSWIEFRASGEKAVDGPVLRGGYVGDEVFKLPSEISLLERHRTVRFGCEIDGKFISKMFYTSTIEDMAGGKTLREARQFWAESNQNKRNKNNRTTSGLYRYFVDSRDTLFIDKYGIADREKAEEYYLNEREARRNKPNDLVSYVRKNPFSIEEALQSSGDDCLFNALRINERIDFLSWQENPVERGNFVWKNGERDTEVIWVPNQKGKFKVSYLFEDTSKSNKITMVRGHKHPGNKHQFCVGCDPYDHDITQDGRRSNGAAYVFKKYDPMNPDFSRQFVCEYINRPSTSGIFYEDMLMMCVYYGASMLFEDNKPGLGKYFERRGYYHYLIKLKDRKAPGLASTKGTHQYIAELLEAYIEENVEGIPFMRLLKDLIDFDINNTTSHDETMAAGFALIADKAITLKSRKSEKVIPIQKAFRRHKIQSAW